MDNIEKIKLIKNSMDLGKRVVKKIAYQMEESGTGGYTLYRIRLDDNNKMVDRVQVGSPDAWDQTIGVLEMELSRQFQ